MHTRRAFLTTLALVPTLFAQNTPRTYEAWYKQASTKSEKAPSFLSSLLNPSIFMKKETHTFAHDAFQEMMKEDHPGKQATIIKETFAAINLVTPLLEDPSIIATYQQHTLPLIQHVARKTGLPLPTMMTFTSLQATTPTYPGRENVAPFYIAHSSEVMIKADFTFTLDGKERTETFMTKPHKIAPGQVIQHKREFEYKDGAYTRAINNVGILINLGEADALLGKAIPALELLHWQLLGIEETRVRKQCNQTGKEIPLPELQAIITSEHALNEGLVHGIVLHEYRTMLPPAERTLLEERMKQYARIPQYHRLPEFLERSQKEGPATLIKHYREHSLK